MDGHGQVRPPTNGSVPELPTSYHEFYDSIADLTHAIQKLTTDIQDIISDRRAEQEEERDNLSHRLIKRKFRKAMREHDREAQ